MPKIYIGQRIVSSVNGIRKMGYSYPRKIERERGKKEREGEGRKEGEERKKEREKLVSNTIHKNKPRIEQRFKLKA